MATLELITDKIDHLYKFYLHTLTFSDPRVETWLFMDSPRWTIAIALLYLLIVWLGPKVMANRDPLTLKWPMIMYNFLCMAISFHIVKENVICGYQLGYSLTCQQVVFSYNEYELRIAKSLWWFYISKLIEMLDTVFFICRKKNSQLTFLHVYHHASMFAWWWIGIKWVAGGQSWFGATLNSFIHLVMYSYYLLAAMGPRMQKYLWWKRYLTQLQFAQFIIGLIHAFQSLYFECEFPLWMQYAVIVYGITIFALFINFYIHAYIRKERLPKSQRSSMTMDIKNGETVRNGASGDNNKKTK
ncbi:elongation of very long chain fatty acids protein 4-like [Patiria miniata]|uniref:Elongation of very long chain fatty acids protein n=1 Tax=Patiria miniata TaxID=46514 RepID=A0A914AZ29_PATMI|nr:elongation of very long chain fatty acids protein 4-like [Patiria miniata]XP_038068779.1 elongation of very long chain fatty acids protein 4-like [Patiria miniata]